MNTHLKPDIHHIKTTRRVWYNHLNQCPQCTDHMSDHDCGLCDIGQAAWHEYAASIEANRSCESVEATIPEEEECEPTTTP